MAFAAAWRHFSPTWFTHDATSSNGASHRMVLASALRHLVAPHQSQLSISFALQDPASSMVLVMLYQMRTKIAVAVGDNGQFGLIRDKLSLSVSCFSAFSAILSVYGCSWVLFFRRVSRLVPAPLTYVAKRCRQLKGSRPPEIRRVNDIDGQTVCIHFI